MGKEVVNAKILKEQVDIVDVMAAMGINLTRSGASYRAHCPFHDDHNPSLVVIPNKQIWYCAANCGRGDVLDFVAMYHGIQLKTADDFRAVAEKIATASQIDEATIQKRKKDKPAAQATPATMADVKRFCEWRDLAMPYFKSRGLNENTIFGYQLGARLDYTNRYFFLSGEKAEFQGTRYVIPWMRDVGEVGKVNQRRDDAECRKALLNLDERLLERIRVDLAVRSKCDASQIEDDDLITACWGPKYAHMPSPSLSTFNVTVMFETDDEGKVRRDDKGNPIRKKLPYVIVTEGEICALSWHEAGYHAIGHKWSRKVSYQWLFGHVMNVFIAQDNDPDNITRNGKVHNPGIENAALLRKALGRGTIMEFPKQYRDSNDTYKAGELHALAKKYNIEPIKNEATF